MWVRFLGWEDPLEKKMATHSNILAWEIPWTEKPGGLQAMELQRVGHDFHFRGFPVSSDGKESACNAGDLSLIPGSERSLGEGNGYPLPYSGMENLMDCMGSQRVGHD